MSILARIRSRATRHKGDGIPPRWTRRYYYHYYYYYNYYNYNYNYYYEGRPLMDPLVTISRAAQSCGLLGEGILRQHLDVISSVLRNG